MNPPKYTEYDYTNWVKLFALKPSFFFKTRFLPQYSANRVRSIVGAWFRRGEVPSPNGLADPTPPYGSLSIDKSTAPWDHSLLLKTGSEAARVQSKKQRNRYNLAKWDKRF